MGVVPDAIDPVAAWRVWSFGGDGGPFLHSRGGRELWPARTATAAVCYVVPSLAHPDDRAWERSHPAPDRRCSCGLYGVRTEEEARDVAHAITPSSPLSAARAIADVVHGEVWLWGRVIEHERGYRAEYAYPKRVLVPREFRSFLLEGSGRSIRRLWADEAADLIARCYGVEAIVDDRSSIFTDP